jgi:hypothetical protein
MEQAQDNSRVLTPSKFEGFIEKIDELFIDIGQLETAIKDKEPYEAEIIRDQSGHRYGDGGEFQSRVILTKSGRPIFVSRHFQAYTTYFDNSEDHPSYDIKDTYLLEEDSFAREIIARFRV